MEHSDYPLTGLENDKKDVGVINGFGVKTPINHLTDIGKYCKIRGDEYTIYKITNYYEEHPEYKCVEKSFVELTYRNQTYIISTKQIKIIKDYVTDTKIIDNEYDKKTYDNSFDINEYVYVKYIYNNTDIDYKYGKIIKKYSDTHYIVHYNNDVAIVSESRLSRSLEL